jgi:aminopeptidase N
MPWVVIARQCAALTITCAVCCLQDPYPKPCYLFTVVAGDLALREASHRTHTGRHIRLQIYVPPAYIEQVGVAQ